MFHNTDDLRIRHRQPLVPPQDVLKEVPATERASEVIAASRKDIAKVIHGQDDRLVVIVGPCSIHDPERLIFTPAPVSDLHPAREPLFRVFL